MTLETEAELDRLEPTSEVWKLIRYGSRDIRGRSYDVQQMCRCLGINWLPVEAGISAAAALKRLQQEEAQLLRARPFLGGA